MKVRLTLMVAGSLLVAAALTFAQTPKTLSFEVASVKPSAIDMNKLAAQLQATGQMPRIGADALGSQPVGRIIDCVRVAPEKAVVIISRILLAGEARVQDALVAGHHLFFARTISRVRVVMILMDGHDCL